MLAEEADVVSRSWMNSLNAMVSNVSILLIEIGNTDLESALA
jgi:hypothetical protein